MGRKMKKKIVEITPESSKKARYTKTVGISKQNSRQHVPCDCNLCKGRKVDPRTKASHMKERDLPIRKETSNLVVGEDTTQINISHDFMDIDIGGIDNENDASGDEQELQEFNFLVTKPKKSSNRDDRRRINSPIVIEQYYSDEDKDGVNR